MQKLQISLSQIFQVNLSIAERGSDLIAGNWRCLLNFQVKLVDWRSAWLTGKTCSVPREQTLFFAEILNA
jgi:hypothetical protein